MAPEGWRAGTLDDLVALKRGHDLPASDRYPGTVPVMGSAGPNGFHNVAKAAGPGVTVGRSGVGSMGTVCFTPEDYWPHNTVLYATDFKGNDPRFTYFCMKTINFRRYNSGSAQASLNPNFIKQILVLLPPLSEQRRIAAVLAALDDKIELNRKMNQMLEEMAQTLFKSWFIDFDGQDDLTQQVQELMDDGVLIVGDGYRAKRSELAREGLPFARAGNIDNGFRFENPELLGEDGVFKAREKVSKPGDVVFTAKGTVGRFAFVSESSPRFVYAPQLCFWRSVNPHRLDPIFLLHWMLSPAFLRQASAVKGQTDMADYVNLRDQRRMAITVPSPADQSKIVAVLRPLRQRLAICAEESRTLTELRDTLLPKLLSGELRIPEAEALIP